MLIRQCVRLKGVYIMDETIGLSLIEDLKNESEKFYDEGKSYLLLQEYYKGLPKDTLRPLFYCEDKWIRRVAIWITAELGTEGGHLLEEVIMLMNEDDYDNYVLGYAIEIVTNCARNKNIHHFARAFLFLEYTDQVIRLSAMSTISALSRERIHEVYVYMANNIDYANYVTGLLSLLNSDTISSSEINRMIDDNNAIVRKYGIIIAKKLYKKYPRIIIEAVNNQDSDVKEFSKIVIKVKLEMKELKRK